MSEEKYYLTEEREVTQDEYIQAERNAGFFPKSGEGVATGSFSSGHISGRAGTDAPRPLILVSSQFVGAFKTPAIVDCSQLILDLENALKTVCECGEPELTHLYDEEGVEGFRWTHPDGREWAKIGDHGEKPPIHPLAEEVLARSKDLIFRIS